MRNKKTILIILVIASLFVFCCCNKNTNQNVNDFQENPEIFETAQETTQNEQNSVDLSTAKPEIKPAEKESVNQQSLNDADLAEAKQNTSEQIQNVLTCSLTVRCDDVLKNPDLLDETKKSVIPPDGIIIALSDAVFMEGESVFDVVLRELKNAGIHFEFEKNPMYNSAYIKGVGNLYEFDCGDCSGWLYKVNGKNPRMGCSQYILQNKDIIELYYSCNYLQEE